jgi:choline dehydrogenase-like flavoprotein
MDAAFFVSDTEWARVRDEERFDFVVVGSGPCALAFAERALRNDPALRILILERGPFFLPEHFQNLPLPYQQTLGGLSETFPWTLSARTHGQPAGRIQWQHGMVPFVGGRSIMWSSWCPRPLATEMEGWPAAAVEAAARNFADAERLLNVVPADRIDSGTEPSLLSSVASFRPVYGVMQQALQAMLASNAGRIETYTRSMPAPLAVGAGTQENLDFAKFSVPGPLLALAERQNRLAATGAGAPLRVVTECVVERILQQDGAATGLETSRGTVALADARLVLAMGTVPPATLLMNSFPSLTGPGSRLTAHFITSIVARVPRADYPFAGALAPMELAAIYMAGAAPDSGKQYHVQLSVLSDPDPAANAERAARYMPDVVATASPEQLAGSQEHLVFVCAVLGELDHANDQNWIRRNSGDDPTTNITLQIAENPTDEDTWDVMDAGTLEMLAALSPQGPGRIEYWRGTPTHGGWDSEPPPPVERRVPALVHEGSTLWLDSDAGPDGVVGTDYRPHGVENVFVTGGGLWPAAGSWNPTLTMVALAQDLADQVTAPAPPAAAD